jgi:hypothetical protein
VLNVVCNSEKLYNFANLSIIQTFIKFMMKKIIFPVLFFCSQIAFSQDLMDKMSKDACSCIEKKVAQGGKNDAQEMMQACVMEAMLSNMNEFMEKYGDAMQDTKKIESFGVELGLKLAKNCPAFMKAVGNNGNSSFMLKADTRMESVMTLEGEVKSFKVKNLATLTLLANGLKEELVIVERFEGSEFIFGKEKELKGKKVSVEYKELEIYNPSKKAFEKQKVIRSVKMK